jgi:hypothetical protein
MCRLEGDKIELFFLGEITNREAVSEVMVILKKSG